MVASIPIFSFHALEDRPSVISFSPGVFRRGLAKLYENEFLGISLSEAVEHLRRGRPFPNRSFVVTFDDGYQSVYDQAFPLLQQYDVPATVFLTVGDTMATSPQGRLPSLEDRTMLSWQEIREMHRWGIDFGAHTLNHADLTRLPRARVEAEVRESKAVIEDTLGTGVSCFAYPYGRFDEASQDIVAQHFACACSDKLGLMNAGSDRYALERVDAYYVRTDRLFGLTIRRAFPWYVRTRSIPRRLRRAFQSR